MFKITIENNVSYATVCIKVKTGINNVYTCVYKECIGKLYKNPVTWFSDLGYKRET